MCSPCWGRLRRDKVSFSKSKKTFETKMILFLKPWFWRCECAWCPSLWNLMYGHMFDVICVWRHVGGPIQAGEQQRCWRDAEQRAESGQRTAAHRQPQEDVWVGVPAGKTISSVQPRSARCAGFVRLLQQASRDTLRVKTASHLLIVWTS